MTQDARVHESVMVAEVIRELHISNRLHLKKARKYIDATEGTGGHTLAIAKNGGEVLGIDLDPAMLIISQERFEEEGIKNCKLVIGNFSDIDKIADANGFSKVSGVVLDLGVSNIHLKDLERGFSFGNSDAKLDMRLNHETQGVKASDLLNLLRRDQLIELFEAVLEPGAARWLAGRVIEFRDNNTIETVNDLLEIVKGLKTGKRALHEATLPFLALRIAVNSELDNLRQVLPKAFSLLEKGGRLLVITFHSGEDMIVKDFFGKGGELILPQEDEIKKNPRARSAKMRVLQKE